MALSASRMHASRVTCSYSVEKIPAGTSKFLNRGKEVPRIGIGLAALGRPGYINLGHGNDMVGTDVDKMRAHTWETLDAAYNAGVRYFDAARSYGKSEEFLSGWLESRGHDPSELLVGSKWGYYYTAEWRVDNGDQPHEVKEHTYKNLANQTAESDGLLGGFIDLYQIHSATKESGVLENEDVLEELAKLKADKGWRIGLTLSGDSLLAAHNTGMKVIVKEAMANGRLTPRNGNPNFAVKLQKLEEVASQLDTTVDALALACVLAQPFNAMVLSGAACSEHLESNYKALKVLERLDAATVMDLMTTCCMDPTEYWNERSALAWN
mmetsp:Transcript_36061/g.60770  ORF Transcript_36061/g.60770 Transcript_36061/m.60770 type:complete len:324 (+) Transcript_36061:51-1022(+)